MDIFSIKVSFKERTRSDDTKGKFSHLHNVRAYFNITYPLPFNVIGKGIGDILYLLTPLREYPGY
jgi:hypothetical protein